VASSQKKRKIEGERMSAFDTDGNSENVDNPFTQFYSMLLHQGNMLADYVRTGTYQRAMINNKTNFEGKIVLDVGTGSGILSFFALQAGAAHVYAVDASNSVIVAEKLAKANGFADRITIIKGKIEQIELPEKVDVIISEPIGFLLVHERMLESYVTARQRFLKPDGLMMPSTGSIIICPFADDALFKEHTARAAFWETNNFYGIDFSSIASQAYSEYFSQAIVGYIDPNTLLSQERVSRTFDFHTIENSELQNFKIDFEFTVSRTAILHGMAGWFDISFDGSDERVVLTTAPESPGTHWYQCKLLLLEPIAVNRGQRIVGSVDFRANDGFSYDVDLEIRIEGTSVVSKNRINLKDQVRVLCQTLLFFILKFILANCSTTRICPRHEQ
jgi:histone-arginine methyltransferase CARM1